MLFRSEAASSFVRRTSARIEELATRHSWVIVNCQAGINRSSAAVLGWLKQHRRFSLPRAKALVKSRKAEAARRDAEATARLDERLWAGAYKAGWRHEPAPKGGGGASGATAGDPTTARGAGDTAADAGGEERAAVGGGADERAGGAPSW